MNGISVLVGRATAADFTRRLGRATARDLRAAPAALAPAALSEIRGAVAALGTTMRDAAGVVSRDAAAAFATRPAVRAAASFLAPSREINEQASTIRMSGLGLGLDTTSPAAPSRLISTAVIGLDGLTAQAASVLSSSATLGLDVSSPETASTITSTGEANTMPTSYGVIQPTFSAGTSVTTLSGTYAGTGAAANATSLTLTITSTSGTIGPIVPTLVQVNVKDQNNTNLGTYSGVINTGGTISLESDIGLSISFGAGTVTQNATASFTVSNTTPTTADATAAFNAGVNVRPRFDGGATVSAGSFTVNGTSVSVLAGDSINSVLARIGSTVAGITASFSGDRVTISSVNPSEDTIALAGDTSGFLAALKLSGATTVTGNVRDDLQTLSKTTQFAAVVTGSFTVNGVGISVNRTTDSLQSIITRINGAGAGVTATYDSVADKMRLTSTANSESDIVVAGDTAGFLTAAKLSTGNTVRGNIHDDKQALSTVTAFSGVTNGSFTVNGVAIAVNAAVDTLQSLISTINASAAGVTAAYDAVTDKLTLTTNASSEDDIVVGNDTSGLLTGVKLNTATTVKGNIADDQQVFTKTTQFATVGNGSFVVNGQTIAVNAADSLQALITRINGAGAGVTASFDATANKVVFTPTTAGATLTIEGDTSGFLAAAVVATGTQATRASAGAAFNATGANGPLFDAGQSVTAGSFTVNGVSIAVAATDTLNDVLARITASQAGVTATFDANGDTVRFVSKLAGPMRITLGTDTSGFLAAVKLDGTETNNPGRSAREAVLPAPVNADALLSPLTAAIKKVNDVLDTLATSPYVPSSLRAAVMKAVGGAVAALPNPGLTLSRVDGKEHLVIDIAALAEALAKNPDALSALVNGPDGLADALHTTLITNTDGVVAAPQGMSAVDSPRPTDAVEAAHLARQLRMLQLLGSLPPTSRGRLELLV